jgi:dipeptidyl aminopeptidase/acylaminoacyl peptidase
VKRGVVVAALVVAAGLPAHVAAAARFAYVAQPPGNSHRLPSLWALAADGTHRIRLLHGPAGIATPVWSPDGRTIAVSTCAAGRDTCKGPAVQLVNATTGSAHRLVRGSYFLLAWSSDGSLLLAERTNASNRYAQDVFVIGRSGRVRTVAHGVEDASLSPDGTRIAYEYQSPSDYGNIYVRDLRTGRTRRVSHAGLAHSPVWSPDGRQLAYIDGSGHDELAFVRPDGTGRRIVQDIADAGDVHWLSNRLLGYMRSVEGPNGKTKSVTLATYDLVHDRRHVIASEPGASDWCAARGGEVVYTTGDTTSNFGLRKLWLLPVTARTPLRLTSGGYGDDPQLAPDCSAVALTANVGDPLITTLTISGAHVRQHRIGVGRFVTWKPVR